MGKNLYSYRDLMDFDWEDSDSRKRWNELTPDVMAVLHEIYPLRDANTKHPFVPWRQEVRDLLRAGARPADLIRAAERYRTEVENGDEMTRKYMLGPVRFYRDGHWRNYCIVSVYGMTREEWARAGKDVLEFDRLAKEREG